VRGGAYVLWRQVQLETRLRIEKEKLDEMNKVCESKDEQIAHLRRCNSNCNLYTGSTSIVLTYCTYILSYMYSNTYILVLVVLL
jgi:hypothetical protein